MVPDRITRFRLIPTPHWLRVSKSTAFQRYRYYRCPAPHPVDDIEQPIGGNLIKTAYLFPKQTEDFDLHVVEALDEIMHLTLPPHADAVNAFQQLENHRKVGDVVG